MKRQDKGRKAVAVQDCYEKVAEICKKHGIEFEKEMLIRTPSWETCQTGGGWTFAPFKVRLTVPGQKLGYEPNCTTAGMHRGDCNEYGTWHGVGLDKTDYDDNETAMFNEVALVLSEATGYSWTE